MHVGSECVYVNMCEREYPWRPAEEGVGSGDVGVTGSREMPYVGVGTMLLTALPSL